MYCKLTLDQGEQLWSWLPMVRGSEEEGGAAPCLVRPSLGEIVLLLSLIYAKYNAWDGV